VPRSKDASRRSHRTWLAAAGLATCLVVCLVGCAAPRPGTPAGVAPAGPASGAGPAVLPPSSGPAPGSASPATPAATLTPAGSRTAAVSVPPATPGHPFARYLVTGARSGVRASVLVRLPPAYFDPANAGRTFPVIETFHGSPGHAEQWLGKLRLGTAIDQAVAAHRMAAAIVISPDMNYPDATDRECVDGGAGRPALETWAAQDVPDWAGHTFRARTDRDSWATIGLSAGGWCAAMSAMLHPDRYRAAVVMSGYFRPQFPATPPYPATGSQARRYDLVALARSAPPPVAIWLETSPRDTPSYPTSHALTTTGPLTVTPVVLPRGDHAWNTWASLLPGALDWLAGNARGFAP
jgi:S-formylglutathione hydrolase FrmB